MFYVQISSHAVHTKIYVLNNFHPNLPTTYAPHKPGLTLIKNSHHEVGPDDLFNMP